VKIAIFIWVVILVRAPILVAQTPDAGMTVQHAAAPGRFVGVVTLRDLAKVAPQARVVQGDDDHEPFKPNTAAQYQALKTTAFLLFQALGLPKASPPLGPAETLSSASAEANAIQVSSTLNSNATTPPASVEFLPQNTNDETNCGGFRAPDGAVAASQSYLVEVNNSCIRVLDPSSGSVLAGPTPLMTFFGSNFNTGDPRTLYDPVNGRFLVSAEDSINNKVVLAASQGSNPTLGWNIYSFSMGLSCNGAGDFPMMGQTYQEPGDSMGGIYLSWNSYCQVGGFRSFVGAVPKSLAYAGSAISSISGFSNLSIGGVLVDSVQPVNVMNALDRPRGEFLVNSFNYHFGGHGCSRGCNGVVIWFLYNGIPANGGSQSISSVVVPTANTYYLSPHAPEPGCAVNTCGPDTGNPDIGGEVTYSSGSLFAALNDGMGILALELEPFVDDSGTISGALMRNEICFACGGFTNGGQAYYGTIQPDSERNWTMVYNYSAPGTAHCSPDPASCIYPSTSYVSRRVTQAQNTLSDSGSILALGQAYYQNLNPSGVNRWGDYTAAAPTLLAPNSYWFDGEYVESNGNWGRAIGRTGYTSPTQP
jgi:hypothetical protein